MKAIGDNLLLVAESGDYTDKQFRDLFLYAIGSKETPPEGLELVAKMVSADQRRLERRIEAKAERIRESKREHMRRKRAESGKCGTPIQPANQPANLSSSLRSEERTSGNAPALETVLAFAAEGASKPDGKPVAEAFAREWHALMEANGWRNTKGRHVAATWRADMVYAWKRHLKFDGGGGRPRPGGGASNQPEGQILRRSGYVNPL